MMVEPLKSAFRHLLKNKFFSFINILGLSVGFAACFVIWRYVDFELSYDRFHTKANSTYRAGFTEYGANLHDQWFEYFGFGLGPALREEIPEVENVVRLHPLHGDAALISTVDQVGETRVFHEEHVLFADSSFFSIFSFEFRDGQADRALDKPGSMVLTADMADKYFGNGVNPIGKVVHLSTLDWGARDYTVSGVIQNIPQNSTLQFDFLLSMQDLLQIDYYREPDAGWTALNFITYVVLREGVNPQSIETKIQAFMDEHTGTEPAGVKLFLQPLLTVNLSPDLNAHNGHLNDLYFFLLISLFVLSIAFINFVNLSTSKAGDRAREVGIRKAIGISRRSLMTRFLLEAAMINLVSIGLSIVISVLLLPILSDLVGKQIEFDFSDGRVWAMLAILFAGGSLLAGFYPAFVLSSFRPIDITKDRVSSPVKGVWLRKGLVVFQFSASLILIIGTFVIYRQMKYMSTLDKGLVMDRMLIVNGPQILDQQGAESRMTAFKQELLNLASVDHVATSGKIPGNGYNFTAGLEVVGFEHEGEYRNPVHVVWVDTDFIQTYRMTFLSGLPWNPETDYSRSVIINEALVASFNLGSPEEAVGQGIRINGSDPFIIQGVIKNFHWDSMRSPYEPMLFRPEPINYNLFSIHLIGNVDGTTRQIEKLYKSEFPGNPFVYRFLDEYFDAQYKRERLFEKLFGMFSVLAVVIACLGLFAFAAFTTSQRRKEIGIRKALGATWQHIIALLSSQFARLFFVSAVITVPLAWYASVRWLDNFAFRFNFSLDIFLLPLLTLALVSMATVSMVILRGANTNVAEVLRSEG